MSSTSASFIISYHFILVYYAYNTVQYKTQPTVLLLNQHTIILLFYFIYCPLILLRSIYPLSIYTFFNSIPVHSFSILNKCIVKNYSRPRKWVINNFLWLRKNLIDVIFIFREQNVYACKIFSGFSVYCIRIKCANDRTVS